jgi:tripartite-type tricarboxylate transporter receptor subunit TctC
MRISRPLLVALVAAMFAVPATAQKFPSRPITLVVPYPAGGNVDTSARVLQGALGNLLGQPIIVENRPGAAGFIAGDYVARAQPDGHTLFVTSNGPLLLAPLVMPKPPYQWESAFEPVSMLTIGANALLIRSTLPVNSVKELVEYAKKNPDKFQVAVDTGASINNFLSELLKQRAGIDWVAVRYRGNAPALTDLIAGHVDAGFSQLLEAIEHVRGGKLRALAVMVKERVPALPDVPTMAEAGYPGVEGIIFTGLLAPKNTPPEVIETINAAVRKALSQKAAIDQLAALGSEVRTSTPAEFADFLKVENTKWTEVAKKANLKVVE